MSRLAGSPAGRVLAAVCSCLAAATAIGYAARLPRSAALATALAALAASALGSRRNALLVALLVGVAALGLARGATAVERPGPGTIDGHLGAREVMVTGTVRSADPGGGAVVVDVSHLTDASSDAPVSGGLLLSSARLPDLAPDDTVEVDASGLRAPGRRPGAESEAILEREGVRAIAVAPQVSVTRRHGPSLNAALAWVRGRLVEAVDAVLPEPAAALVLGIAFGIHRPLSATVRAPLQDAGLVHIVVVSGLKVVIVIGLAAALAAVLAWSRRRTLLVIAPAVTVYVLLSGAGPAAVRSAVMAGAALLVRLRSRSTDPLPVLAVVAALMLVAAPPLAASPGYQLSFLGTAGIVCLTGPLASRLPGPRVLVEPFAVTVAASLATVPVMAGTFGVVSLVGPIANALVLPLLPPLMVAGALGGALSAVQPALGWLPLQLAGLASALIRGIAGVAAALPGAALHISNWPPSWSLAEAAGLVASLGIVWRWGRRAAAIAATAGIGVAVLAGVVAARPDGVLHVTVLDVGPAPAAMVQAGDGGVALIDSGSSPELLLQALGRVLPPLTRRIDLVVLTGGEPAAAGGLAGLIAHYIIGTVIAPPVLTAGAQATLTAFQDAGVTVVTSASRSWRWGGAAWRCLEYASSSGRQGCALSVADATGRLLALGDADPAVQDELAAEYGTVLRADVLIAPPGGVVDQVLLEAARPAAVAGPTARGSTPGTAPLGYAVERTGVDGDLAFIGGAAGLQAAR